MTLQITSRFAFDLDEPTDALLQFEVAHAPGQVVSQSVTSLTPVEQSSRVAAHDGIGERIWTHASGIVTVDYCATVAIKRATPDLSTLAALASPDLPGEAVQYLFGSRYCPADIFQNFVTEQFEGTQGGARIDAIRAWIADTFTYASGASDASTDATASFVARQGVCRDYAHVLIALARASAIPARYVACYAPNVMPQDFHAVVQVFLADADNPATGSWHLVDATGMARTTDTAIIGVGRDAADVSFLTSFGPHRLLSCCVQVDAA